MSTALILSGSYLESNRYLQAEGVRGRHATNASTVVSAYFDRIVQLPSFANRPDRHAIAQAVRRKTRGRGFVEWVVLDEWTPPVKVVEPEQVNVYLFGDLVHDCVGDENVGCRGCQAEGVPEISATNQLERPQDVMPPSDDIVEVSPNDDKPAPKKRAAKKAAAPRVKTSDIDDLFGDA